MKIENLTTIRLGKDQLWELVNENIAKKLEMRLAYLEWDVDESGNLIICKAHMCAETMELK